MQSQYNFPVPSVIGKAEMGAKTVAETIPLRQNQKLASISKEYHTRKEIAYIAEDKLHGFIILSQRLSGLVHQINAIVTDKPDQVSIPGLYKIISTPCGRRCGGYSKHRWKIQSLSLTDAASAFEAIRKDFANAIIVGSRDSYTIACV